MRRVCLAIPFAVLACRTPAPALLITGAAVHGHPGADAVLIEGERVAAIGGSETLRERAGSARVIDARGGAVLPGFHDAHIHMLSGGFSLEEVDLSGLETMEAVLAAVSAYAAAHPEAPWIKGRGWSYGIVPAGRFPRAADLDAIVPDRPVYLESYDGHAGWASSRALERAGVRAETPDPADGRIVRGEDGKPEGALLEGAVALVERAIPAPERARKKHALERAARHCVALGITSVEDITADPEVLELYAELEREGRLPLRVSVTLPLEGDAGAFASLRERFSTPLVRTGYLKGFVDGVVESKTAYMLAPYEGAETRGAPLIPPDRLHALVKRAHAAGFPVALHAIGDAAVRLSLDTFERVREEEPRLRAPDRVEHIEVIDAADVPRFAALGVVASMQPYHAVPDGDAPDSGPWSENLGEARRRMSFAWKTLADAGATLMFGSDWPVMTADPLEGLAVATTRRDRDGRPDAGWNAHQAIPFAAALDAYRAAKLEPGAPADLIVLAPGVDPAAPATLWARDEAPRVAHVIVNGVAR